MYVQSTTTFYEGLHDASWGGDCCTVGLLQTLLHVLPSFMGATKGGTFTDPGQSTPRDLSPHKGYPDLQAIAVQRCLYHGLTRLDSSLNSIFMLGGAPKAREVYSERSMRNTSGCNIK